MTNSKMLRRLAEFAPPVIAPMTKPGPHCVLSTAIGQMVLERLGVPSEPYVAEVSICNSAWVKWAEDDFVGGKEEQLSRGAHLITNRPNFTGESLPSLNPVTTAPWNGHLVLRAGAFLIDLDMAAFVRPTRNICLPAAMVASIDDDNTVSGEYHINGHVTLVRYAPLVASYAEDYLTSKDWTLRDRYEDRVAEIVKLIR